METKFMDKKIGFIGFGKMGSALAESFSKIIPRENIIGSSPKTIKSKFKTTTDNNEVVEFSDIVFISVKPNNIDEAVSDLQDKDILYVSIAAGVKLSKLEKLLPNKRIIRVMPNTPCLVGEMAAAYSLGKYATQEDKRVMDNLLNSAGIAYEVEEEKLDTVTALSGSGPAFIAYIAKAMIEEAINGGLTEDIARKLTYQTLIGTGKILLEKGMNEDELISIISSPNGTTVAGREVLEDSDVYDVIRRTIRRAKERSIELGMKK